MIKLIVLLLALSFNVNAEAMKCSTILSLGKTDKAMYFSGVMHTAASMSSFTENMLKIGQDEKSKKKMSMIFRTSIKNTLVNISAQDMMDEFTVACNRGNNISVYDAIYSALDNRIAYELKHIGKK